MSKGKFQKKGSKILVLMLAMMLVFGMAVGGTLAYLMAESGKVTNTFTVGDINIELWETDLDGKLTNEGEDDYKILPGTKQSKDPYVVVKPNSEACWVFVEITEKNNYLFTTTENGKSYTAKQYIEWTIDETADWEQVSKSPAAGGAEKVTYVYGKKQSAVAANAQNVQINVLKNKEVKYDSNLSKADLNALGNTKPVLEFKAYAIQSEGLKLDGADVTTAAAAWNVLNSASNAG